MVLIEVKCQRRALDDHIAPPELTIQFIINQKINKTSIAPISSADRAQKRTNPQRINSYLLGEEYTNDDEHSTCPAIYTPSKSAAREHQMAGVTLFGDVSCNECERIMVPI